ncbi:MAG: alcohol dehydrogenase [Gammaproteobacteria bacterium]|nr:alcohol dehydrogenase [Gammaproteobacteria bacterium]MBK80394.1 alcohol dehydrogenase [Gammaproteobacteria bacterium]|tara:strand:+ start:3618 stop:4709 length:1092 start_codon:yes stop_codon:yes gene_type:complete
MGTPARVAVLPVDSNELRIESVTLPDPGPTQVVVRQFASGICHSQLHQIHRPREQPVILGHESTGVVLEVGADVTHVRPGDTVLVTWVPRNASVAAAPPVRATLAVSDGEAQSENVFTWADHTLADQQYVVKVDPGIRTDVTAIIGCAIMTGAGAVINTAGVQPGESVAVFGVGGVGLSAVVGARVAGANPIIAVDLDDEKLEFARRFGATHGINASREDPIAAIHALTARDGEYTILQTPVSGVDYAFDCIGIKATMEQIVPACRTGHFGARDGGTAVLVGVPGTTVELNAIDVLLNEKHFIGSIGGSCAPDRDFPRFLEWQDNGDLDLDAMVTRRFTLDQINEATAALEAGRITGRAILEF